MVVTHAGAEHLDIAVGGGALFYERAGAGSAVVLLHGWTLDSRMWTPQLNALAATHLLIAPDRRGFGRSSAPPDLSREADDVARLLDAGRADSAVIVGMSQAGRVAADFAQRFSDRTRGLVLQGAPLGDVSPAPSDGEAIPIETYAALVRAGRLDEMKRLWGAHPLMRTTTPAAAACAAAMLADYMGRDLAAMPAAAIEDVDPAHITVPMLIITGAQDVPGRRRGADALASKLPHASRVEIEGAGHLCNLCAPDAYNAALNRFLNAL
ncbi:MAG: alpha/beta fold hydrolase [Hyphomonadaceae bacterium]